MVVQKKMVNRSNLTCGRARRNDRGARLLLQVLVILLFLLPDLDLACSVPCQNSVTNMTPNECLGTIDAVFQGNGLTTAGKPEQNTYDCGSEDTTLRDVIFQFSPSFSGIYQIFTITSDDTTMQVENCDGSVIKCNDDRTLSDKSSFAQVSLNAGQQYIIGVSKRNPGQAEVTFSLRIQLVTTSPSPQPTTLSPSQQPNTSRPTLSPSSSPVKANEEVAIPIEEGGGGGSGSGSGSGASSNDLNLVAIGGGVGGALALVLGVVWGKRTLDRRRQSSAALSLDENWSPVDEEKLRHAYHQTHDMNALYVIFPQRSRESIAEKLRQLLQADNRILTPRVAKSTYLFVKERTRAVTSKFYSKPLLVPVAGATANPVFGYRHQPDPIVDRPVTAYQYPGSFPSARISTFTDY